MSTTFRLMTRNMGRRPLRTALTSSMVVLSVALLLVSLSWIRGAMTGLFATSTASEGHVRVATEAYVQREELFPLHEHLRDLDLLTKALKQAEGVSSVEARLSFGVALTKEGDTGETLAMASAGEESYFVERLKAKEGLLSGNWLTGASNEVLVGSKVAEEAGLKAGDKLNLLARGVDSEVKLQEVRLQGIVTGIHPLDSQVLVPLHTAQQLTGVEAAATEVLVFGKNHRDAANLAKRLSALPETSGLSVQAWTEREPWNGLITLVKPVEFALAAVLIFLTALGIWNTMTMSVLERSSEIGVLRAMGMSRPGAVLYVVGEAALIGTAGSIFGVLLGLGPAWLLAKHGITVGDEAAASISIGFEPVLKGELSLEIVMTCILLGLSMAVAGSLLPALRSASIPPVTAMRSRR